MVLFFKAIRSGKKLSVWSSKKESFSLSDSNCLSIYSLIFAFLICNVLCFTILLSKSFDCFIEFCCTKISNLSISSLTSLVVLALGSLGHSGKLCPLRLQLYIKTTVQKNFFSITKPSSFKAISYSSLDSCIQTLHPGAFLSFFPQHHQIPENCEE